MDVDKAFLPGAAGQIIAAVALFSIGVIWYILTLLLFFANSVAYFVVLNFLSGCISSFGLLVFSLLFAVSLARLHSTQGTYVAGILGVIFGFVAGILGVVFAVLDFLNVRLYIDIASRPFSTSEIVSPILIGLTMLSVGVFFMGYQKNFSKGLFWKATGMVYVSAGITSFLIFFSSFDLVMAAFIMGALCFLGEKSGSKKPQH